MNNSISPTAVTLVIIGIIVTAVVPPIGVLVLGLAILAQHHFRAQHKRAAAQARAEAYRKAWTKNEQARLRAYKSFKE